MGLAIVPPPPGLVHLAGVPEQPLHVVADFVGDDVGPGKIARRLQLPLHVLVKRQVDVDPTVPRTVERPHRGLRGATGRLHLTGEQHQGRLGIVLAHLAELLIPNNLGVVENDLREVSLLFLFRIGGLRGLAVLLIGSAGSLDGAHQPGQLLRIDPEHQREQEDDQSPRAADDHAGLAQTAAVFDILALLAVFPLHDVSPGFDGGRSTLGSLSHLQQVPKIGQQPLVLDSCYVEKVHCAYPRTRSVGCKEKLIVTSARLYPCQSYQ
jgi:hypothetical protein